MRALVIDDELLVLEGLEAFLQAALPDISLDKTADTCTALSLAARVPYEIILLDWHLADEHGRPVEGREVVQALREAGCDAPILVVSGNEAIHWPPLILELGLSGVVRKSSPGNNLLDAISIALKGGIYLPAQSLASRRGSRAASSASAGAPEPRVAYPELTDRQAEVFAVMSRGLSDKQIARELGISEATVKTHVRAILTVVGVRRRGEAIFELNTRNPAV